MVLGSTSARLRSVDAECRQVVMALTGFWRLFGFLAWVDLVGGIARAAAFR
jgi:hypothetical protein